VYMPSTMGSQTGRLLAGPNTPGFGVWVGGGPNAMAALQDGEVDTAGAIALRFVGRAPRREFLEVQGLTASIRQVA
jgi:hypothetical protein